MSSEPFDKSRLIAPFLLGVIFCCIIAYGVFSIIQTQLLGLPADVQDMLRGQRIIILRLPTTTVPLQQIEVNTSIQVYRVHVVSRQSDVATEGLLTEKEWQAIDSLRTQWCLNRPQMHKLGADEPFYDIGLRCGDFDHRRIRVPLDSLPPELALLLDRVPPF